MLLKSWYTAFNSTLSSVIDRVRLRHPQEKMTSELCIYVIQLGLFSLGHVLDFEVFVPSWDGAWRLYFALHSKDVKWTTCFSRAFTRASWNTSTSSSLKEHTPGILRLFLRSKSDIPIVNLMFFILFGMWSVSSDEIFFDQLIWGDVFLPIFFACC